MLGNELGLEQRNEYNQMPAPAPTMEVGEQRLEISSAGSSVRPPPNIQHNRNAQQDLYIKENNLIMGERLEADMSRGIEIVSALNSSNNDLGDDRPDDVYFSKSEVKSGTNAQQVKSHFAQGGLQASAFHA